MEKAACNKRFCASVARRKSARLIADPGISYRLTMFKLKLFKHNIFYFKLAVRYFSRRISNSTPAQSRYRCTPLSGQPFAAGHRTHCPIKYSFVPADTGQ
jgi:hypothetical protein